MNAQNEGTNLRSCKLFQVVLYFFFLEGLQMKSQDSIQFIGSNTSMELPKPPIFNSISLEREYRKQQQTAAFRAFASLGFDEGIAGHITTRDPEYTDTFWVNPFG